MREHVLLEAEGRVLNACICRVGPGPGLHSFLLRPVTGPVTGAAVPAETQCLDGKYGHITVTQSPPARDRPQDAEYKRWPAA